MKRICRILILTIGLVSGHDARAGMITVQGALQEEEPARLDPDHQPAGGDPVTIAVFILMFLAIFALSVTPERD